MRSLLAAMIWDSNGADFLNALRVQLLTIQVRFGKELEANTAPTVSHKGMIKTAAGGFAAAFFLMLMFSCWVKKPGLVSRSKMRRRFNETGDENMSMISTMKQLEGNIRDRVLAGLMLIIPRIMPTERGLF